MRVAVAGGALVVLASCTFLVPIDDDVTAGRPDAGTPAPIAKDATPDAVVEVTTDAGVDAGSVREGCPGPPDDPSLVGWYPLDEKAGSIAHDCAPSHNDLAPLAAKVPVWSEGKIGGAVDIVPDGMCFAAVDPALYAFEDGRPFTVAAWLFVRQFEEANGSGRWAASHKTSPRGWHFGVDGPDRAELDLEFVAGATNKKTEVSAVLPKETWVHVASTYAPGSASTYRNGVLSERVGADKVPAGFDAGPSVVFHLGCRNDTSGGFDGRIDDLRIYDRALTDSEIATLAARGR